MDIKTDTNMIFKGKICRLNLWLLDSLCSPFCSSYIINFFAGSVLLALLFVYDKNK